MARIAGIAGMTTPEEESLVSTMLDKSAHRGTHHRKTINSPGIIMQAGWNEVESQPIPRSLMDQAVWDGLSVPIPSSASLAAQKTPFALAAMTADGLLLARDRIGVKPLYYGPCSVGMAFASEVKSLLPATRQIHELPTGKMLLAGRTINIHYEPSIQILPHEDVANTANGLRLRLEQAIARCVQQDEMGSWLSGGLDSSAIAALARPFVRRFHSFVSGVDGAEDLIYGRQMAEYLGTEHHELKVTQTDMLDALPDVIYHLESFDALLVRSSVTNYLTAKMASNYVESVFSGEGGDELFAGYEYIKSLPEDQIQGELLEIIYRLHNTALQRVDRCSQAHGLTAFIPFLDPDVLDYALAIPVRYKLFRDTQPPVEKWILRKAVEDVLPASVLWRPKSKFWQGAGVVDLMEQYAEQNISDADFKRERNLSNGWKLNSKEEFMYFRIFLDHFGELENLDWMGRTKGAPVT